MCSLIKSDDGAGSLPLPEAVQAGDIRQAADRNVNGKRRQVKLWEIPPSFHCTILGTCLSMAELRKTARKLGIHLPANATDYFIHSAFVDMVQTHEKASKTLHKALNRKYARHIKQVRCLENGLELLRYWRTARDRGDIPGPYWAVMSHWAADSKVRSIVFGDVHMLSHLVGSANRSDIRRLHALEEEHRALLARYQEEGRRMREKLRERDAVIADLQERVKTLGSRLQEMSGLSRRVKMMERQDVFRQLASLREEVQRKDAVLARKQADIEALERQLTQLQAEHAQLRSQFASLRQERDDLEELLAHRLEAVHESFDGMTRRNAGKADAAGLKLNLKGLCVLYVGGRPSQVRFMRSLVERAGGKFLHHDGGVEDGDHRLMQMLMRSDVVLCPVDCVSHSACQRCKKICLNRGTPFVPLRSTGLSSFASGLKEVIGSVSADIDTREDRASECRP